MQSWNCCRTCLSAQNLHPIFNVPGQNEKYTDVIFATTGMKVEATDSLPQEMCAPCITFINESYKFRRKCEMALKALMDKKHHIVKLEQTNFKTEKEHISIVISDLQDDDFKDFDDNITLDTFQYAYDVAISKDETNGSTDINIDNTVLDLVERPLDAVVSNKRKDLKPVRRKAVKKKEQKAEKEEIQCEHCKKILTSKLSLRNHYKIHTGFDVVCEHCGKKFITRRLLLMHCRAKHGYEKTDKCSYCEYRASNAEQVKIHERLHTGERPYVCGECGAGFHRKSSYLQHIAIHLPEKTVQCELCPARFKSVTLMRIHKSRHRAPQHAFRCGVCGGSFARRRNAARHLARAHAMPAHAHAHEHIQRVSIA